MANIEAGSAYVQRQPQLPGKLDQQTNGLLQPRLRPTMLGTTSLDTGLRDTLFPQPEQPQLQIHELSIQQKQALAWTLTGDKAIDRAVIRAIFPDANREERRLLEREMGRRKDIGRYYDVWPEFQVEQSRIANEQTDRAQASARTQSEPLNKRSVLGNTALAGTVLLSGVSAPYVQEAQQTQQAQPQNERAMRIAQTTSYANEALYGTRIMDVMAAQTVTNTEQLRALDGGGDIQLPTGSEKIPQQYLSQVMNYYWRNDLPGLPATHGTYWHGPAVLHVETEDFKENPGGKRITVYFDKSRLEVMTNPDGSVKYISQGLLPVEMISGRIQTGESARQDYGAANIPIAGDMTAQNREYAPTYAALQSITDAGIPGQPSHAAQNRVGQFITGTIDARGTVGEITDPAWKDKIKLAYYATQTQHNIPQPFWDFLNRNGQVYDAKSNTVVQGLLNDPWYKDTGLPLSEAYMGKIVVGGQVQDAVFQDFERKILVGRMINGQWVVEWANIAAHYHDWRYKGGDLVVPIGTPTPNPTATPRPDVSTPTVTPRPTDPPQPPSGEYTLPPHSDKFHAYEHPLPDVPNWGGVDLDLQVKRVGGAAFGPAIFGHTVEDPNGPQHYWNEKQKIFQAQGLTIGSDGIVHNIVYPVASGPTQDGNVGKTVGQEGYPLLKAVVAPIYNTNFPDFIATTNILPPNARWINGGNTPYGLRFYIGFTSEGRALILLNQDDYGRVQDRTSKDQAQWDYTFYVQKAWEAVARAKNLSANGETTTNPQETFWYRELQDWGNNPPHTTTDVNTWMNMFGFSNIP